MKRFTQEDLDALRERIRAIDPLMVEAEADVDPATLEFAADMAPLLRLASALSNAYALARFRRDAPASG